APAPAPRGPRPRGPGRRGEPLAGLSSYPVRDAWSHESRMSPVPVRSLASRILLDLTPLRRSRDYRALIPGLGASVLGNQLTTVAVPFQVYAITRSSLVVGLVAPTQLFPLIFGSLFGGSLVDAMDRGKI